MTSLRIERDFGMTGEYRRGAIHRDQYSVGHQSESVWASSSPTPRIDNKLW
jgi:hypothetical protein